MIQIEGDRVSGRRRETTFLAQRSYQGGRIVYTIRVPLTTLDLILPLPDPDQPIADNRRVDPRHAKAFGDYIKAKQSWVAPTLLTRDNGGCRFVEVPDTDGQIGYLTIPWATGAISPLTNVDGQHRILGIHLIIRALGEEVQKIDREIGRTTRADRIANFEVARDKLTADLKRLENESVGVDIYLEPSNVLARQMFVDVADNAKGISSALRARFDSSKVANRILDPVIGHALLKDKIDLEQDRMTGRNPNLMGAKHVADLIRGVAVGVGGRMGRQQEQDLADEVLVERVHGFLNCLADGFADLSAIAEGALKPVDLRAQSLLGSVGMLRVLAGVYHELLETEEASDEEIIAFFSNLDPHMNAPASGSGIWLSTVARADFEPNGASLIMRTQNLVHLAKVVTGWYRTPPNIL
ncbi:DNA sulfur modification protein DndB [Pseudofrankia inefficax]|uniref:DGQHR domain protein n=1 Tax=Pseudofrankia inefficax (strain DSM 45817 / CECT 9037 / DDB 130130 / EuI1c) TaxID=298654 RepID=E3JC92_PSEI1|nr:DNA sulfur modification protein DndB [Pseudofrankia inefficax]ADP84681.1 DGQHR domain protein [Pseudofrankia inefficax]